MADERVRILLLACALAACGASPTEVSDAKTATYNGGPQQIYDIGKQAAVALGYAIGDTDDQGWKFLTVPKFFSPEGDSETAGPEGFVHMRDGSVQVQLAVQVIITAEKKAAVLVTPVTYQKIGWSPKPRELAEDDPYLPTFVTGRADALAIEIHQRARKYNVFPTRKYVGPQQ